MPSLFDRLFRRPAKPPDPAACAPAEAVRIPNPVAIPISDGTSPELFQRVPKRQPRDPSRKWKRRTPEGNVADHRA